MAGADGQCCGAKGGACLCFRRAGQTSRAGCPLPPELRLERKHQRVGRWCAQRSVNARIGNVTSLE